VTGDELYLRHILEAIDKIGEYTAAGREGFFGSSQAQDAVIRRLEIIGEAVKRLSVGARRNRPQIPWKEIAGMRDVLIHDYMGVDLAAVWEATQQDLPALRRAVADLLRES
jgi:uncharacterized protein with HEPN domain